MNLLLLINSGKLPAMPAGGPGAAAGGQGGMPQGGVPSGMAGMNCGSDSGTDLKLLDRVKPYAIVAQALSMKCSDFAISLLAVPNQSIQTFAVGKSASLEIASDTLTKAYQTALAQDVSDGVIAQAQADPFNKNLSAAVTAFVSNTKPLQAQLAQ